MGIAPSGTRALMRLAHRSPQPAAAHSVPNHGGTSPRDPRTVRGILDAGDPRAMKLVNLVVTLKKKQKGHDLTRTLP